MANEEVEIDEYFQKALDLIENTNKWIFLTGRAGSGKSTLLKYFREITGKKMAVVAPTGVAAVNVEGETIHSFFGFGMNVGLKEAKESGQKSRKKDLYRNLDTLVIDEISMVRADLLDCVDHFLRVVRKQKRPFGGLQVVMIGDMLQLPPVVTREEKEALLLAYRSPYFFSSAVMKQIFVDYEDNFEMVELLKIYRQSEEEFVDILNKIRDKTASEGDLMKLNDRCEEKIFEDSGEAVVLVGTNAQADDLNSRQLSTLKGKSYVYKGRFSGDFTKGMAPADPLLVLKEKARVMFLANDKEGRWVNGTTGTVTTLKDDVVTVQIDGGEKVKVGENRWTMYKSRFDEEEKTIVKEEVGGYTQLPLRLAWAVTVHKSQGKTFDRVIVDLKNAFAPGQTYVALSRCRTLDGLKLRYPINQSHLKIDWMVSEFLKFMRQRSMRDEITESLN